MTCSNGVHDGAESDVDCGGGACPPCGATWTCVVDADCYSERCVDSTCAQGDAQDPCQKDQDCLSDVRTMGPCATGACCE